MASVLVESFSAVEAAFAEGYGTKDTWITTAPFVYEKLADLGHDVRWLDDTRDGRHVHEAGHIALSAVDAISDLLLRVEEELAWPRMRIVTAMRTHPLMCALVYKSKLLDRFLSNGTDDKVIVGSTAPLPHDHSYLGIGQYNTVFAILASRMTLRNLRIIEHHTDVSNLVGTSDRPTFLTRLVSLSTLQRSHLLWRLWKVFGFPEIKLGNKNRRHVILDGENEAVREMFPVLVRQGYRVSFLRGNKRYPNRVTSGSPPSSVNVGEFTAALESSLRTSKVGLLTEPAAQIAADLIVDFLAYLTAVQQAAKELYKNTVYVPAETLLLAGNVGSLIGHAVGAELVTNGGKTALAQHGASAGMSRYHGYFKHISEARLTDFYLVNAPAAADFYNKSDQPNGWSKQPNATLAIGLPAETAKVPAQRFQRFLVRKSLGAKRNERVTMAVIGTYQNNMLYQPGMPNDRAAHDCFMTLSTDVLPRISGLPVLKLYSTYRFTDADPLEELRRCAAPVVTLKDGDFRFLRAAADVIVFDSPLSTIGWAFGAGCPLIYLAYPGFALTDDTKAALEKALFFIDASQPGWAAKVRALLDLPMTQLKVQWEAMQENRMQFLERYITPHETPAASAPRILDKIFTDTA